MAGRREKRKGKEQDARKWVKRGESGKAMRTGLQKFSVARTRIYPDAIINRTPYNSTPLLEGMM